MKSTHLLKPLLLLALGLGASLSYAQQYVLKVPVMGLVVSEAPIVAVKNLAIFSGYKAWEDGTLANSCRDYLPGGGGDGVYRIELGAGPINVFCDMTTDGGGWTLAAWNKGNSGTANLPADFMVSSVNPGQAFNRTLSNTASSINVEGASRFMQTTDVMLVSSIHSTDPIIHNGRGMWDYDKVACDGPIGHTSRTEGCYNHLANDHFDSYDRFNIALYTLPGSHAIVPGYEAAELCYPGGGRCSFEFYLR